MSIAEGLKDVLQGRDEVTLRGAYGVELFAKRLKNDELTLSMRGANGWELVAMINGAVEYSRVLFGCVAETIIETLRNAAQAPQACEAMPAPAASQNVAQSAVAAPRCAHFKSIFPRVCHRTRSRFERESRRSDAREFQPIPGPRHRKPRRDERRRLVAGRE